MAIELVDLAIKSDDFPIITLVYQSVVEISWDKLLNIW